MIKISQFLFVATIMASMAFPAHAKSRHEMCEIAEMAVQTISQKLGDSIDLTAQKRSAVHNQCFTAPLSEIEETYNYLLKNWDTVFDNTVAK